jgi:tetratricopeptide (TPR) repeat protein
LPPKSYLLSYSTGNQNVNETNALSLTQENHPAAHRASSENEDSAPIPGALLLAITATASTRPPDGHESYERATALKNVGLFRQAAEDFEKAAQDPAYALKGFAQMGLSLKKSGKQVEAVAAFRRALQVPSTSSKEQVQILYLLGRTLESLERIPEALETYRWLRREAPQYRDVAMRIESLSMRRMHAVNGQGQVDSPWAQQALQMWQGLRARIVHEGSLRKHADAKRDGHSET